MIRKLLFLFLYIIGVPAFLRRKMVNDREISILLFHRISNESDLLWPAMPIKSFEKLILKLKNTVEIISFKELKSLELYPRKPLMLLSFDDGYVDFLQDVMPIFKRLQIKANHNICPGLVEIATPLNDKVVILSTAPINDVIALSGAIVNDPAVLTLKYTPLAVVLLLIKPKQLPVVVAEVDVNV